MQVWSLFLVVCLSKGAQDTAVHNVSSNSMVTTEYMQWCAQWWNKNCANDTITTASLSLMFHPLLEEDIFVCRRHWRGRAVGQCCSVSWQHRENQQRAWCQCLSRYWLVQPLGFKTWQFSPAFPLLSICATLAYGVRSILLDPCFNQSLFSSRSKQLSFCVALSLLLWSSFHDSYSCLPTGVSVRLN